jgi:hypothetical protein
VATRWGPIRPSRQDRSGPQGVELRLLLGSPRQEVETVPALKLRESFQLRQPDAGDLPGVELDVFPPDTHRVEGPPPGGVEGERVLSMPCPAPGASRRSRAGSTGGIAQRCASAAVKPRASDPPGGLQVGDQHLGDKECPRPAPSPRRQRPCAAEQFLNGELQALASTGLHRLSRNLVRKRKRASDVQTSEQQGSGIPEARRGIPCKHSANGRRRTGQHRDP